MLNHTMWPPAHCINAKKKKRLDRASRSQASPCKRQWCVSKGLSLDGTLRRPHRFGYRANAAQQERDSRTGTVSGLAILPHHV